MVGILTRNTTTDSTHPAENRPRRVAANADNETIELRYLPQEPDWAEQETEYD